MAGWIKDHNENHPHSGLRMRSPREFIAAKPQPPECPVKRGQDLLAP
ncbi:MAG: putative transposase [Paracoccaceae bacterium]